MAPRLLIDRLPGAWLWPLVRPACRHLLESQRHPRKGAQVNETLPGRNSSGSVARDGQPLLPSWLPAGEEILTLEPVGRSGRLAVTCCGVVYAPSLTGGIADGDTTFIPFGEIVAAETARGLRESSGTLLIYMSRGGCIRIGGIRRDAVAALGDLIDSHHGTG